MTDEGPKVTPEGDLATQIAAREALAEKDDMCRACWEFYENNGEDCDVIDKTPAIIWAVRQLHVTGFYSRMVAQSDATCIVIWNRSMKTGKDKAELERIAAEYRQPPPDYTETTQALRLLDLAADRLEDRIEIVFDKEYTSPWGVEFLANGAASQENSFGMAVLAACYAAIQRATK